MDQITLKGAIFDLDGVITQTALIHSKAWKATFDPFLKKYAETNQIPFVPFSREKDYLPYVDGKPRNAGIQDFLASRNIELPMGKPSDGPEQKTVYSIGNRKNEMFKRIIHKEGVQFYESTLELIDQLKTKGIKIGVASSSKNCKFILKRTQLDRLFGSIIGGIASNEYGLKGKPHPDIFITAAHKLGLRPNECLMVEDAISGVQAGKNGNFGLVIGIAREGNADSLKENGADMVVEDLEELNIEIIENWFNSGIEKDSWMFTYYGFNPQEEKLRETLTTIGNGYFGTRGCMVDESANTDHYPGTYIAGVYNKIPTKLHNRNIYNNDFVNCPNWLPIHIKIGESDYQPLLSLEILSYSHTLNLKEAMLCRSILCKDDKKRITQIDIEQIASMHNPHLAAIRYKIRPKNYSEKITILSSLDGSIINAGVPRYLTLNGKHLKCVSAGKKHHQLNLCVQTTTSKTKIYMATKHKLYRRNSEIKATERSLIRQNCKISEEITFDAYKGSTYFFEKLVSIYTSKDQDTLNPKFVSLSSLYYINSFEEIYTLHKKNWAMIWERANITITGDRFTQKTIRLHIYHLIVTASLHNKNIDTGMPARGLHGEAYRGHIFWDEVFIFPFYNYTFPEITRALLKYRYNRLEGAKKNAKQHGFEGAMYPWQTADTAEEETQSVHYNPLSDKWDPDLSRNQRHVSLAIGYNIHQYFLHSDDKNFLLKYGLEILIEICRFWSSKAQFNTKDNRYHIKHVMGPDEFHEKHPGSKTPGLTDNAYTNIMVCWLLQKTIQIFNALKPKETTPLKEKLKFSTTEIKQWQKIIRQLNIILSDDQIIAQFKGYFDLEDLNWQSYRQKYGDIHRMDRILKAENDTPDHYKIAKQADVLMAYYLLSPLEVKTILNKTGHTITNEILLLKKNYDYYIQKTSHGSSLSWAVHAKILQHFKTHKKALWDSFAKALTSDVLDVQGGTTQEGIHCGVMASTIDIIIRCFAGVSFSHNTIKFDPHLPDHWTQLSFKLFFRKCLIEVTLNKTTLQLKQLSDDTHKLTLSIDEKLFHLSYKNQISIELKNSKKPSAEIFLL